MTIKGNQNGNMYFKQSNEEWGKEEEEYFFDLKQDRGVAIGEKGEWEVSPFQAQRGRIK